MDFYRFYMLMMVLLITSILLQVIVGIGLLVLARMRISSNDEDTEKQYRLRLKRADTINNWVVIGVFILTVINVFISAFGLNEQPRDPMRGRT